MRAAALLTILCAPTFVIGQTADVIQESFGQNDPETEFWRGRVSRMDSAAAKTAFSEAARLYDGKWDAIPSWNHRSWLAVMRGRAHFLADELPQAIRAFRDGLDLAPWDADLQRGLAVCRAKVAYPTEDTPAERMRPDPFGSLRDRMSPTDLLAAVALSALLLTVGLARRFTTEDSWSTPVALVGLLGLLMALAVGIVIDRQNQFEREHPVVVVAKDTVLRTGNGDAYPPRVEAPLPRGAEVRELGRRGGWVQVELPGGAVGWLPAASVLVGQAEKSLNPFEHVRG